MAQKDRQVDREVTLYYSPQGKSEWFKRGQQPDGWTLDDSKSRELAAEKERQAELARKKEIDDAVQAELKKRGIVDDSDGEQDATEAESNTADDQEGLTEEEEKELADLQAEIDKLDELKEAETAKD